MRNRASLATLACGIIAVIAAACGAASPQTEAAKAEAGLFAWPVTTTSDEARQQIADGLREFDMSRTAEAYQYFTRALAADSTIAMAHLYAAYSTPVSTKGLEHLNAAVALSGTASPLEKLIIGAYDKSWKGNVAGALADAQQLVKDDPESPRSWMFLARVDSLMTRTEEARVARTRAMELAPDYAVPYIRQSMSYSQLEPRDPIKAEQLARKAIELVPNEPVAHDVLGDALRAQGRFEEAGKEYTTQAELDPTSADALNQRGHVNTFLGKYAEARADYDACNTLAQPSRKAGLFIYRAYVHLYEGDKRAAFAELERIYLAVDSVTNPSPNESRTNVLLPMITLALEENMVPELERTVRAWTANRQALDAKVNSPEFHHASEYLTVFYQAHIPLVKGDYAQVRKLAAEYMNLRKNDSSPTKDRPAHELLAFAALREKKYAEAAGEFEQADPTDLYNTFYHAEALEGAGRLDEAQRLYRNAAEYNFNNVARPLVHDRAVAKLKKTP